MASSKSATTSAEAWLRRVTLRRKQEQEIKRAINGNLIRLAKTANGIRKDHKLDDLVDGIEAARAQGILAMAEEDDEDVEAKTGTG